VEELIKALVKAKQAFKPVIKDKKGARSKYATLDSVHSAIDESLLSNGLFLTQPMTVVDGQHVLMTWIWHTSGHSISSDYYPIEKNADPQKMGAAITYARRYQLCAMLGITADEDTDAEGFSPSANQQRQQPASKPAAKTTKKGSHTQTALESYNAATVDGMTNEQIQALMTDNNLPNTFKAEWTKEQSATFAQLIQDEIAKRNEETAA